jgi:phenylacetate-CoA ligase
VGLGLDLYHKLPPPFRSVVASSRGFYLRWWRYDNESERLVDEALERDSWSAEEWEAWRTDAVSKVLERAANMTPYYSGLIRSRDFDWRSLENWPVLEKATLRADGRQFVASDRNISRMFHDHTSGTTGSSLDIWLTRDTVKRWYALFEARARRWYGVSRHDRWAILGGQIVVPVGQQRPPFWVWNAGLNQLYLSAYHLSPELTDTYLDALLRYRVKYLMGYPSAMYQLALAALRAKRKDVQFKVAITNAEPVYEYQRTAILEAFGCPTRETYGMAEIAAAASECEKGSLHQWPEVGVVEVDKPSSDGSGELICTGLLNRDMPLIRYRVGDRGKLSDRQCECGRKLPVVEKIEGRNDDVLFTRDGRAVGRLDPIFKGGLGIEEAQIIQNSFTDILVKLVAADGFGSKQTAILKDRIRERLGDINVELETVDAIPRTSRGKFRAVICNLPSELRRELETGGVKNGRAKSASEVDR